MRSRIATLALLVLGCGAPAQPTPASLEVWAFHAPWDPRSTASASEHRARIDVLVSGWIALDSLGGIALPYVDSLAGSAGSGDTRHFALVTTWLGDRFRSATIRELALDRAALARTAALIARHAGSLGYAGLVLDFEDLEREDLPAVLLVAGTIADSARAHGAREIAIAIPAVDTANYPARPFLSVADRVLVMLYDEHWSTSPAGPIASPEWVRRAIGTRVAEVGPSRVVAALPFYGYMWRSAAPGARTVGLEEARRLVEGAGLRLERDAASRTLRASRAGEWELWVSDAELLRALLDITTSSGVQRVAFWRLGLEDPDVWELLRR